MRCAVLALTRRIGEADRDLRRGPRPWRGDAPAEGAVSLDMD